jgi:hypothetical protein
MMKSSTRYQFIEGTNSSVRLLYEREGLVDTAVGFATSWGLFA